VGRGFTPGEPPPGAQQRVGRPAVRTCPFARVPVAGRHDVTSNVVRLTQSSCHGFHTSRLHPGAVQRPQIPGRKALTPAGCDGPASAMGLADQNGIAEAVMDVNAGRTAQARPADDTSTRTQMLVLATIGFAVAFWAWALLSPLGPTLRGELSLSSLEQ